VGRVDWNIFKVSFYLDYSELGIALKNSFYVGYCRGKK
jgi:hypothetical protein